MSKLSVKNSILSFMMQKRINNIDEFCKNPIKVQGKVLAFLISKGKNTAFGQAHHFSSINDYAHFSKNIPNNVLTIPKSSVSFEDPDEFVSLQKKLGDTRFFHGSHDITDANNMQLAQRTFDGEESDNNDLKTRITRSLSADPGFNIGGL